MPIIGRAMYLTIMIPIIRDLSIPDPLKPFKRFPPIMSVRDGIAPSCNNMAVSWIT
nr:hypothetical protein Iba_scaffold31805CG0020 [Ipomoea batatas]